MKLTNVAFVFAALQQSTAFGAYLRRNLKFYQQEPCVLQQTDVLYADHNSISFWECEMTPTADSTTTTLPIVDLSPQFVEAKTRSGHMASGRTMLFMEDAEIANGKLILPADKEPTLIENHQNGRKLLTAGNRTVLAVRVEAPDGHTTSNEAKLREEIFGIGGSDSFNMASQFTACSYDQLNFSPATEHELVDQGVYTVTISQNVIDVPYRVVESAVLSQLTEDLGDLESQFDHVMLCLPQSTGGGGWIAYARINRWLSVYKDRWCEYPSAQMHFIGTNLILGNSGENGNEFESGYVNDQSGMMGVSYDRNDDGPAMCFNGAKSWQLGWYTDRHTELNPLSEISWNGTLVGISDYAAASGDETVILKINTNTDMDYYVNFNRKDGINSGTMEGGNQVMITTQGAEGNGYASSTLLAKLDAGSFYTISNFDQSGKDVTVTVGNIHGAPNDCRSQCDVYRKFTISSIVLIWLKRAMIYKKHVFSALDVVCICIMKKLKKWWHVAFAQNFL